MIGLMFLQVAQGPGAAAATSTDGDQVFLCMCRFIRPDNDWTYMAVSLGSVYVFILLFKSEPKSPNTNRAIAGCSNKR